MTTPTVSTPPAEATPEPVTLNYHFPRALTADEESIATQVSNAAFAAGWDRGWDAGLRAAFERALLIVDAAMRGERAKSPEARLLEAQGRLLEAQERATAALVAAVTAPRVTRKDIIRDAGQIVAIVESDRPSVVREPRA